MAFSLFSYFFKRVVENMAASFKDRYRRNKETLEWYDALAMAVANEVWMMENATYSILSPEGFASILWKDAKRASEAAKVMKMTAEDLYELGMIERIICEDEPATDDNIEEIGRIIDRHMREFFQSCAEKTPDEIAEQRYERFRKI